MHLILQLSTDGEATQVIASPTPGQMENVAVVNSLFHFHLAVCKVVDSMSNFPGQAVQVVQLALQVSGCC